MTAGPLILSSKPVAAGVYTRLEADVASFARRHGRTPSLTTVLVGEDPASQVYVGKKGEMCRKLGFGHKDHKLPATTTQAELMALVKRLNEDDGIDGILVQKPLPKPLNESAVFDAINPLKDVDCFHPANVGLLCQGRPVVKPCTPAGVMEILAHYGIPLRGARALVVGRSDIVGKPMGMMLLKEDATVTYAHSRTKDIPALIAESDIVVAAIGRAKFLGEGLPWRRDSIVIDVGVNRLPDGKLAGDVDYEKVLPLVKAITPVPGGVGPMTIAMLMVNTLSAARARLETDR